MNRCVFMKSTIIIPVFNEEKNILDLLNKIPNEYDVIVVDDGSTDKTYEIIKKAKHRCIHLDENKGKGFACMTGAMESKTENIVFIDGDGQHDPREISKLIEELKENDIVIGKRSMERIPIHRNISNRFARKVISIACRKDIKDALCGLRAVKKSSLLKLKLEKNGYEFESEMLIKASRKGMKIKEVPVSVKYKIGSGMPISKSLKLAFYIVSKTL